MKMRIKFFLKNKFVIGFLVLLVVVGGFFATRRKSADTKPNGHTTVEKGEVKQELTLSGKVAADEQVTLQFQTGGLLTWVGVKEGDEVKKYQAIASLDIRQVKKTLDKYLNTYLKTRWTFDQTHDDNKDKILTDQIKRVLDQSQFDLSNSVLDVEIQDIARQLATLTTPIGGIVTRVDAPFSGVNIIPSQATFEVVNPATLYFQLSADQTDVVKLKPSDTALISLDAFPDATVSGRIIRIGYTPKSGETGTVYEVRLSLESTQSGSMNGYRLGMTGDATFTLAQVNDVLRVPSRYVKKDAQGSYLLVGKDKKKEYIEVGLEGDTFTQIRGALREGDIVYD